MSDYPENIKFWNFFKFLLVYIVPIVISACLVAIVYKVIESISVVLCVIFVIISFPIYLYLVIKTLWKMINNNKITNWIEKPWDGIAINFKK